MLYHGHMLLVISTVKKLYILRFTQKFQKKKNETQAKQNLDLKK